MSPPVTYRCTSVTSTPAFRKENGADRPARTASPVSVSVPASDRRVDRSYDHPPVRAHLASRETQTSTAEDAEARIPFPIDRVLLRLGVLPSIELDDEIFANDKIDAETRPERDLGSQLDAGAVQSESHD